MTITQIVLTALLTVFTGTVVFVLGQIVLILFIERVRFQARTVEAIAEAIVNYAREYTNPVVTGTPVTPESLERLRIASENLRALSASLRASAQTLRCYRLFQSIKLVLPRKAVIDASSSLMALSNLVPPNTHEQMLEAVRLRKEIEHFLAIDIPRKKD
jgi:hypothetical protein